MDRLAELLDRPRLVGVLAPVIVGLGLVAAIALGRPLGRPSGTIVSPSPGPSEVVVPGGWRPIAWSPDGSRLLVRRGTEFGTLDADGTVAVAGATWAAWLPGAPGTLGLAETTETGTRLLLRDGSGSRTVADLGRVQSAAWSADGARWAASAGTQIRGGRIEGGDDTLLDRPATALGWDSDSGLLAARVVSSPNDPEHGRLYLLDPTSGEARLVPNVHLGPADRFVWSTAGGRLVFTGRVGERRGLYLLPADLSRPPTPLTGDVDPQSVHWSADGGWLSAARLSADGPTTELITVHVAESGAMVGGAGPGRVSSWAPDAERFLTVDPVGNLVVVDAATAGRTLLATAADGGCTPAWSRAAGQRIAYCDTAGNLRIRPAPP